MRTSPIVFALLALSANAQERCQQGVYASVADDVYLTVHTNGERILGAMFSKLPTGGAVGVGYPGIGTAWPQQVPIWQHQLGTWDGSGYLAGGLVMQGACYALTRVTCDESGDLIVSTTGMNQLPFGTQWGIDCAQAYREQNSSGKATQRYPRFF